MEIDKSNPRRLNEIILTLIALIQKTVEFINSEINQLVKSILIRQIINYIKSTIIIKEDSATANFFIVLSILLKRFPDSVIVDLNSYFMIFKECFSENKLNSVKLFY